uniref:Photolyase/cryptochrome alpha/beta domain-containing protein n=1 Tax=viral metagenome TaxID=1070528 RepID=A0A6C0BUE1_9ZZZZ
MKPHKIGVFLFHRDLRVVDNTSLNALAAVCDAVVPVFIFTPEQVTSENKYKSDASVQFMIESLDELATECPLVTLYGDTTTLMKRVVKETGATAVGFNEDYTPYAVKRDKELVEGLGVKIVSEADFYLTRPGDVVTGSGTAYKVFTPFYEAVLKIAINKPSSKRNIKWHKVAGDGNITLEEAYTRFTTPNPEIAVKGGRKAGLKVLTSAKSLRDYDKTRDTLSLPTTQASAYLKFGCVSVREMYRAVKGIPALLRQLIWRDFYAHVLFAYPDGVLKRPPIKWTRNKKWLDAWKEGRTGFPLVDAAMRQLNTTGYMHNRGRMLVASFLSKILLIDWREGERYFATKLVDYDIASNSLNWQNTIFDNLPYVKIFNPWNHSKEHDSDATYIKRWVPELRDVEVKEIHKPDGDRGDYVRPIVDYAEQREKAMGVY